MDTVIIFTPSQLLAVLLSLCAAIVSISAASAVIARVVESVKKPNKKQNARLDEHENRLNGVDKKLEAHELFFSKDKARLEAIEESNRVTQKALLALLAHAIDGNNTTQLKDAKDGLETYLLNR